MVTIRTTEDFIKAMDENPEWLEAVRSRLLTRELLDLPSRFEELSAFVHQLAESQVEMKKEMANLAAVQAEMLTTLKKHGDDIGFLNGLEVERLLGKQVYGLLGGYPMRMRRVRILRGYFWTRDTDEFNDAVNDANESGKISDEQYDRLMRTDLIVSARRRGSTQDVYLALEASGKINGDDVDRANRSKEALQTMFAEAEILAAVYGREISEGDRRYADSNDATVFMTVPS